MWSDGRVIQKPRARNFKFRNSVFHCFWKSTKLAARVPHIHAVWPWTSLFPSLQTAVFLPENGNKNHHWLQEWNEISHMKVPRYHFSPRLWAPHKQRWCLVHLWLPGSRHCAWLRMPASQACMPSSFAAPVSSPLWGSKLLVSNHLGSLTGTFLSAELESEAWALTVVTHLSVSTVSYREHPLNPPQVRTWECGVCPQARRSRFGLSTKDGAPHLRRTEGWAAQHWAGPFQLVQGGTLPGASGGKVSVSLWFKLVNHATRAYHTTTKMQR